LKRNDVNFRDLEKFRISFPDLDDEMVAFIERTARYEGYIQRERGKIKELKRLLKYRIPQDIDFSSIKSLSKEARDTLEKFKPENMAQASRLQGITPSDLTNLLFVLKEREEK
jgi:tRNA uridine 5-carboxymethylaminomethyl modification enzyme